MFIIDFTLSKEKILDIPCNCEYSKNIKSFLVQWFSDSEFIEVNTSGTTGKNKKIIISKSDILRSANMTCDFFNLSYGCISLLCLPVDFIAGKLMIIRAYIKKMILICIKPSAIIEYKHILKLGISKIDFSAFTPMQLLSCNRILSICDKVLVGGAAINNKLYNILLTYNIQCYESYGMTETITHVALKHISKIRNNYFSVLNDFKISVDRRSCLIINTPYQLKNVITNDIVNIIENNKFKYIGRYDNVINSGGIKLNPEIIEEKLSNFIDREFIISSINDDILGEKLILIIKGEKIKLDLSKCNLDKFEIPKHIFYVDEIPKNTNGKIIRNINFYDIK